MLPLLHGLDLRYHLVSSRESVGAAREFGQPSRLQIVRQDIDIARRVGADECEVGDIGVENLSV